MLSIINYHLLQNSPYSKWEESLWEEYVKLAIEKANEGGRKGEVPIGALLVDPDKNIVASAYNSPISMCDPTAHAEILVLRRAGQLIGNYRLNEMVLITTLEPCIMCLGAMVHARISGVVFGASDLKAGAVISKLNFYDLTWLNYKFWVIHGILEKRCAEVLKDFFKARR